MLASRLLLFTCFSFFVKVCFSKDVGNIIRLDGERSELLEELKQRIFPKLKEDFMKHDWYFYQYLKENDWNIEKAELGLLNYLTWREDNNMANIDQKEISDLEKKYPYKIDGVDKMGRPVLLADLEKWDLTEAASTPETVQRFFKHYNRIFDEAAKKVMAMQNAGMNVTVFLADLDNVNSAKHVNLGTSGYYWQAASLMEKHFPGMFNNIILINTPGVWQTVTPVLRYVLSEETNKRFQEYGSKDEWKAILDNMVDPGQLPPNYGGTKGLRPFKKEGIVGTFYKNKDGQWVWGKGGVFG